MKKNLCLFGITAWCVCAIAVADMSVKPVKPAAAVEALPEGKVFFLQSEAEKRIREELGKPTAFDFRDAPLGDAVQFLAEKHKIPVVLDLNALQADGKSPETLINRKFSGTFRAGLRSILDGEGLSYCVRHGELVVTTRGEAEIHTTLRVYQVHDLVAMPNDPGAAYPDYEALFWQMALAVEPDTWHHHSGSPGRVESFDGPGLMVLVVVHTENAHAQIEQFLLALRQSKCKELAELQAGAKLEPTGAYMWSHGQFAPAIPHPLFRPPQTPIPAGKVMYLGSEAEQAVVAVLDQPASFDAKPMTVEELCRQVREKHSIPTTVDLTNLTADGQGLETLLRPRGAKCTLREAIGQMLDPVALTVIVRNDELEITTRTAAETRLTTRLYQVHDLVMSSGSDLEASVEVVEDLVRNTIHFTTWIDGSGTPANPGTIVGPGVAVIHAKNTEPIHHEVEQLLNTLRAAKEPKVYELQRLRPIVEIKPEQGGGMF